MRGETLSIRGDFQRKPRVLLLAFLGVDGLGMVVEYYHTEGTFDKFVQSCKDFVYSTRSNSRMYPGPRSVWILDGASIHRNAKIIHYLRSVVWCQFFSQLTAHSSTQSSTCLALSNVRSSTTTTTRGETFHSYEKYDMSRVYEHCGWK